MDEEEEEDADGCCCSEDESLREDEVPGTEVECRRCLDDDIEPFREETNVWEEDKVGGRGEDGVGGSSMPSASASLSSSSMDWPSASEAALSDRERLMLLTLMRDNGLPLAPAADDLREEEEGILRG